MKDMPRFLRWYSEVYYPCTAWHNFFADSEPSFEDLKALLTGKVPLPVELTEDTDRYWGAYSAMRLGLPCDEAPQLGRCEVVEPVPKGKHHCRCQNEPLTELEFDALWAHLKAEYKATT